MRKLFALAALLASLTAQVAFADVDCRGHNQFTGGHDGPPKHQQNVCTK